MIRARKSWLLALAAIGLLPAMAGADETPIVLGRHERPTYVTLDPFSGYIGLRGFYNMWSNKSNGQSARSTDTLFTQDLSVNTGGTVISKNLLYWTGSVTASLFEDQFQGAGSSDRQFGIIGAYDLEAYMLSATDTPVTAYARQSQNYLERAFAGMLRSSVTDYGATFRYASVVLPTVVNVGHTTTTQTDVGGALEFSSDADHLDATSTFHATDRQQVTLHYGYTNNTQSNPEQSDLHFEAQETSIAHTWQFDPAGRFVWTQGAGYSAETGEFPNSQFNFVEGLRMRLTDTLSSAIDYRYDKHDDINSKVAEQSLNGSVSHHLYESLTTTANAGVNFSDRTFPSSQNADSTVDNWNTSISSSYTKKVPLGRLGANVSLGYSESDNSAIGSPIQVRQESHTFVDPQPIILTRPGVNESSIVVFDSSGTRQFVEGIDYTTQTVGNTVQINRIVGGNIGPNDPVRLNYVVDPLPGYNIQSPSFGAGLNYMFEEGPLKGLYLFTQYTQIDQTVSPSSSPIVPNDVRDIVAGAEYRIWKLTFHGEGQDHHSTLAPFRAQRFSAVYSDLLSDRTSVSLSASQVFLEYPTNSDHSETTTVDGFLSYQIMRDLKASFTARWRHTDDNLSGTTTGIEEDAELRWKVRQSDIYVRVRHTDLLSAGGDSSNLFFQFGLRRNF